MGSLFRTGFSASAVNSIGGENLHSVSYIAAQIALNVNIHHREIVTPVTKRDSRDSISLFVCELHRQLVYQGWEHKKPTPSVAEAIGLDYRGFHEPATSKHIIRMTVYVLSRS